MMQIAIPTIGGKLSSHFGHCEEFVFFDADEESRAITEKQSKKPPEHEPGVLPRWLAKNGANVVIAGSMGRRAQDLFIEQGITVVAGAPDMDPRSLVESYLAGTLESGDGDCGH